MQHVEFPSIVSLINEKHIHWQCLRMSLMTSTKNLIWSSWNCQMCRMSCIHVLLFLAFIFNVYLSLKPQWIACLFGWQCAYPFDGKSHVVSHAETRHVCRIEHTYLSNWIKWPSSLSIGITVRVYVCEINEHLQSESIWRERRRERERESESEWIGKETKRWCDKWVMRFFNCLSNVSWGRKDKAWSDWMDFLQWMTSTKLNSARILASIIIRSVINHEITQNKQAWHLKIYSFLATLF
jgi:hypothetical protein